MSALQPTRPYYAHTLPGMGEEAWEPLADHLYRVANLAQRHADAFDAGEWGRMAGLWHDLGKYSDEFQAYLRRSAAVRDGHREEMTGRVDHSTAGAQHAARLGSLGTFLAYCIAGHHAGLPDAVGGPGSLSRRLTKPIPAVDAAPPELTAPGLPRPPGLRNDGDRRRAAFAAGFFTRMLFSCLVDADFLATEGFMNAERGSRRRQDHLGPSDLLPRLNAYLEEKRSGARESVVNARRQEVLAACRAKAGLPPGIFSLNVPTGGGKTLSSLAFALDHAARHGLRRVVYAIPFTSIIEQTADEFRKAMADLSDEVLEHHSNLDPDDPTQQSETSRLAAENFDAALIVTTNVQLFESCFSSQTSRCRKLHRLARSVIVLDEAQALPPKLLAPTLVALDQLVRNYGTTVVLCTATQPAIERRKGFPIGFEAVTPIIDEPQRLHLALRRTRVRHAGMLSDEQLAESLRGERKVLCVVNSRRHAVVLMTLLGDPSALHLSAGMCGAHRSDVLKEVHRRLKQENGGPCRVISTQVIEAGVDVDFPAVYRAAAGLDSVAQAAGRCNREGLLHDESGHPQLGEVTVFDYDEQAHRPPHLVRVAAGHFREVAPDHAGDLLSPEAVENYFRLHYWQQGGDGGHGWDRGTGGLSVMRCFGGEDANPLHHQFREGAERYQLIDEAQTPVLVPYGEGSDRIRELVALPEPPMRWFDRRAQRFVVGVYDHDLRRLMESLAVVERHGRYYLADREAYDERLGLRFDTTWTPIA